ncbi:MAG: hypothetical protein GW778_04845 [Alphaproteobacteria bacterium]|nr:hypothetical protein [Alphaproteobacteria bacterium]
MAFMIDEPQTSEQSDIPATGMLPPMQLGLMGLFMCLGVVILRYETCT